MDKPTFGEIAITPMSEPVQEYSKMIGAAKDKQELLEGIDKFGELAWDAYAAARQIEDWKEWRKVLRSERKSKFAGEDMALKYGAIMMPEAMMGVGMVAVHFGVPFGLALIRLLETGKVFVKDGKLNVDSLKVNAA